MSERSEFNNLTEGPPDEPPGNFFGAFFLGHVLLRKEGAWGVGRSPTEEHEPGFGLEARLMKIPLSDKRVTRVWDEIPMVMNRFIEKKVPGVRGNAPVERKYI